jgi:hypothetical protein
MDSEIRLAASDSPLDAENHYLRLSFGSVAISIIYRSDGQRSYSDCALNSSGSIILATRRRIEGNSSFSPLSA